MQAAENSTSLPELLTAYNAMLGWTQRDLAQATGIDTAVINRLFKAKTKKPHKETVEAIVDAYQRYGISTVTVEQLMEARELPVPSTGPFGIPQQWLRLIGLVMSTDEDTQDMMYRLWSQQFQEIMHDRAKRNRHQD